MKKRRYPLSEKLYDRVACKRVSERRDPWGILVKVLATGNSTQALKKGSDWKSGKKWESVRNKSGEQQNLKARLHLGAIFFF